MSIIWFLIPDRAPIVTATMSESWMAYKGDLISLSGGARIDHDRPARVNIPLDALTPIFNVKDDSSCHVLLQVYISGDLIIVMHTNGNSVMI